MSKRTLTKDAKTMRACFTLVAFGLTLWDWHYTALFALFAFDDEISSFLTRFGTKR